MSREWYPVTDNETIQTVLISTQGALPKAGDHPSETVEISLLKGKVVRTMEEEAKPPEAPAQYYKAVYRKQNPNFDFSSWHLEAVYETRDG